MKSKLILALSLGLTLVFGAGATQAQPAAGKQATALTLHQKLSAHNVKPASLAQKIQQNVVTRPLHVLYYQWDGNSNAWDHTLNIDNTYDAAGNNTEIVLVDAATNQNYERYQDTYNAQNQLTQSLMQTWSGSAWENLKRKTYTYDAQGNPLVSMAESWMSGSWMPTDGERHTYTYNSANHMTSDLEEEYANGTWVNLAKTIMVPNASGAWLEITSQEWTGSAWENTEHMYNAVWHNFSQFQLASFISQEWKNNQWVDAVKYSATYTANNSSEAIMQLPDSLTGTWMNAMKMNQNYDAQGNNLGLVMDMWDGTGWSLFLNEDHVLTYNASQYVTEAVIRFADFSNPNYTNIERFVHTGFHTLAAPTTLAAAAPAAYPNPTAAELQISTGEHPLKSVQLFDLTGRQVFSRQLSAASAPATLDLQHLPTGMYLLRTETSQGIADQKITKL
jgi:hypothetical protein